MNTIIGTPSEDKSEFYKPEKFLNVKIKENNGRIFAKKNNNFVKTYLK